MTNVPSQDRAWRVSTYSGTNSNCVEVRGDLAAVRDSKQLDGPVLRAGLAPLVASVKAGRFDR